MATEWKSQQCFGEGKYYLQFETDDREKFKFMEKAAQSAIDGKLDIKTEVARQIFAEIDDVFLMFKPQYFADAPHLNYKRLTDYFAELKNKYTKEGVNNERDII